MDETILPVDHASAGQIRDTGGKRVRVASLPHARRMQAACSPCPRAAEQPCSAAVTGPRQLAVVACTHTVFGPVASGRQARPWPVRAPQSCTA